MKTIMARKNINYELVGLGIDEVACYKCGAGISGGGILQIKNKVYCPECAREFFEFVGR